MKKVIFRQDFQLQTNFEHCALGQRLKKNSEEKKPDFGPKVLSFSNKVI